MGSIGFEEMLIVAIVAIVIYGRDLPSIARKAGRWYGKLKRQVTDMKDEIVRQIPDDDDFKAPPSSSEPDPPGHAPPSPSAGLPGPDPSDPEYKGAAPFDPSRGAAGGNGTPGAPSPEPEAPEKKSG
ncbi:MAG TPA: twin-arginine translocase TatA/TatE family subunit [Planctomycetota bacterium]|jgi:Sec-independent protein translocase protein TatA|nr:twin-arginine translocase TatA/TatE family subunit [Planctomycetota bacterium]